MNHGVSEAERSTQCRAAHLAFGHDTVILNSRFHAPMTTSPLYRLLRVVLPFLALIVVHGVTGDQGQCVNSNVSSSAEPIRHKWVPEAAHPCTVERITAKQFQSRFGPQGLPPMFPTPIVIVADPTGTRNAKFRQLTSQNDIQNFFPENFNVTLSSSNSFSEHRLTIPLSQYLDSLSVDTTPDQLSNETWYLFGETFSEEWKRLLRHYEIPRCQACDRDMVALSFGIGNRGSGVQWHVHGAGFAETIWGRKHWVLQHDRPDFHKDQTSRNWMENNYNDLSANNRPLECTLSPGDLIYFPDMWFHATINLDPYTVFVSTFTQEHLFVEES